MPFPFTDLPGNKMRPALVPALKGSDVTLAFITTKLGWAGPEDVIIQPDAENGLKIESIIRIHKIATIQTSLVEGRLGTISPFDLELVKSGMRIAFKL